MLRVLLESIGAEIELLMGVVRMGADRAEHVGKALGDSEQVALPAHPC
jgi:hypothetical protein